MRVNKAKRKLLKWERYDARSRKICSKDFFGSHIHRGHVMAYSNYSNANRYVPIGIRSPYRAKWMVN